MESPDRCINEILEIHITRSVYLSSRKTTPSRETELLRIKIARLVEQLERREKALSAPVNLWEDSFLERMKQKEEIHETEDRASLLIRDWYYDAERKDQSCVDGGKAWHI